MALENNRKYAPAIGKVIINECLDKEYKINTSKLMKLLYYMQKLHIQKYGEPMFTNEILALETGPCIPDVKKIFSYGMLGFNERVEKVISLLGSHKYVANIVLDEFGVLTPIELMRLSLDDNTFKAVWKNGLGKNQAITFYHIVATSKKNLNMKLLSKNNKNRF